MRRAGVTVVVGSLFFIIMRLLSPEFRAGFDGVAVGLTAIAAFGLLFPEWLSAMREKAANARVVEFKSSVKNERFNVAAQSIAERTRALGWSVPEGGVYEALTRLSHGNPRAAISGAYATIALLIGQVSSESKQDDVRASLNALIMRKRIQSAEAHLLEDVIEQIDVYCAPETAAQPETDAAMLRAALGTLAFLERAVS
ncbi:MAG: hypothetical protein LBS72_05965 [Oscillospiraceae bacterium]|jgi:hypothetical protein|nr:hypothetical protein [Oscillospiraceae bacterium]